VNVAPLIRAVLSTLRRAAAPKPEWDVVRCDAGWRLEQQVFELGELDWREVGVFPTLSEASFEGKRRFGTP